MLDKVATKLPARYSKLYVDQANKTAKDLAVEKAANLAAIDPSGKVNHAQIVTLLKDAAKQAAKKKKKSKKEKR